MESVKTPEGEVVAQSPLKSTEDLLKKDLLEIGSANRPRGSSSKGLRKS